MKTAYLTPETVVLKLETRSTILDMSQGGELEVQRFDLEDQPIFLEDQPIFMDLL